jgi:large subunit ribosomal protein L6
VKTVLAQQTVKVPDDVEVKVERGRVSVKGPLGKLERDFTHAPIAIRIDGRDVVVEAYWPDKQRAAMVGTVRSHIRNMITGVLKGFTYRLKVVFAHFPVNVKVEGSEVVIENFGGERRPRIISVPSDINVSVEGDDIVVKGIDLEEVSQAAANIQQGTRIRNKDPRVFLDGIYIFEHEEGM